MKVSGTRVKPGHYRYSQGECWIDVRHVKGKLEATFNERAEHPMSFSASFWSRDNARTWAYDTLVEYA